MEPGAGVHEVVTPGQLSLEAGMKLTTVPESEACVTVMASSSITKSGSMIAGNTRMMVIVKTDPGYAGNPGHAGTGTVIAVICQ